MANGIQVGLTPQQTQQQQQIFAQMMANQQAGNPPNIPPRPNYVRGAAGQMGSLATPPVFNPYNLPGGSPVGQPSQIPGFGPNGTPATQLPLQNAGGAGMTTAPVPQVGGGGNQPPQQPGNAFQGSANNPNPFNNGLANLVNLRFNPGASTAPVPAPAAPPQDMYNNQNPFFRPPNTPSIETLSNGGSFLNAPIYTPQQQSNFSNLQELASQRFANPERGFEPIEDRARRQFQRNTIPSLAERFTAMGGGQRSSAFQGALGEAGSELESQLAQLRGQYGQQAEQQALQQMNLGLTPLYNQQYTEPFSAGNAAAGISGQLAQAGLPIAADALRSLAAGTATPAAAQQVASALGIPQGSSLGSLVGALAPYGLAAGAAGLLGHWLANVIPDWFAPATPRGSIQPDQLRAQVIYAQNNPAAVGGLSPQAQQYAQQNNMSLPQMPSSPSQSTTQSTAPSAQQPANNLNLPVQPVVFTSGVPSPQPLPRQTGTQIAGGRQQRTAQNQAAQQAALPLPATAAQAPENQIIRATYGNTTNPQTVTFAGLPNTPVAVPEASPAAIRGQQQAAFQRMIDEVQAGTYDPNDPQQYMQRVQAGIEGRREQQAQMYARAIAQQYANNAGHQIPQAHGRISGRR